MTMPLDPLIESMCENLDYLTAQAKRAGSSLPETLAAYACLWNAGCRLRVYSGYLPADTRRGVRAGLYKGGFKFAAPKTTASDKAIEAAARNGFVNGRYVGAAQ